MQLELPFFRAPEGPQTSGAPPAPDPRPGQLQRSGDVDFIRQRRARRYILRVRPDGSLRVTIPRGGSRREAEAFLARHRAWAERERLRVAAQHAPLEWHAGDSVLLDGVPARLRIEPDTRGPVLVLAEERVRLKDAGGNLRPAAEHALRRIAERVLPARLRALAAQHGLQVSRVIIRNQRSRWGSCSHAGAIALNFRLVQMPPAVRDYVLLHELMHLRQQNHSRRYWRLVEQVCPEFRAAERWLRIEGRRLF